jgi:glycosyltransferase involved in cell wall biosynthesis/2-polyprenyl-3-methyl-5-hydroxy-6-metoxy-1,4-benzoquinol methylase
VVGAPTQASDWFGAIAPRYAERYRGAAGVWHRHFFGSRRRIALSWLKDAAPRVVADVGSGPGMLTDALRAAGARVIAIDRSAAMARLAREGGARATVSDALALPLRDGSCDAAVALGLTSYLGDLAALFSELARVVRPGGIVIVSVANAGSLDWRMRRLLRAPAALTGANGLLTSGIELRTHTPEECRHAADAAGLRVTAAVGHDFTVFPLSRLLAAPSVALSAAMESRGVRASLASQTILRLERPGPPRAQRSRAPRPRRVVRVIARLNVGGPALHAVIAAAGLRPEFDTTLAVGRVAPGEAEATDLLARHGVTPVRVASLGRSLSPADDLRALGALLSLMRRVRPDIVHTHTAKAGALGRVAARLAGVPCVVHTFHGHVFDGYFGKSASRAAVAAERVLARLADRVVAVSDEVARDLAERCRVVPRRKLAVVRVGVPLADFLACDVHRGALRRELALPPSAPVVALVGRLVPVKEPHLAFDAWRLVRRAVPDATLVVVGDGDLMPSLRARGDAGVVFLGWRRDLASILADADLALLTSRNEGTPVALVEAAAAGVAAVATRVGGVPSVVEDGATGLLVAPGDAAAIASAVTSLLTDPARRRAMGDAARVRAVERYGDARLFADLRALYGELLARRPADMC